MPRTNMLTLESLENVGALAPTGSKRIKKNIFIALKEKNFYLEPVAKLFQTKTCYLQYKN